MVQTLIKAHGVHMWYEYVIDPFSGEGSLRPVPTNLKINLPEKQVAFEEDRLKLLFLDRQMRLLG